VSASRRREETQGCFLGDIDTFQVTSGALWDGDDLEYAIHRKDWELGQRV
jgi:hypothetical protein